MALREEHLLFDLRANPAEYLFAEAVTISGLCRELSLREISPIVHVVLPLGVMQEDFARLFGPAVVLESESALVNRRAHEFDLVVRWDIKSLYEKYAGTRKHVTQVLGFTIGADPPSPFPLLERVAAACGVTPQPDCEKDIDVLLLEDTTPFSDVCLWLMAHMHELSVHMCATVPRFELFSRARMVVGWRSFYTYLAAALGCAVVELYPEDVYHRNWLSKWSAPGCYQMVGGTAEEIQSDPACVMKGIQLLWEQALYYRP